MTMRDAARNLSLRTLRALSGAGRAIRLIVMYHSIGRSSPFSIPEETLRAQLDWLAKNFRVVQLRDLPAALSSQSNVACLTFDDGYKDNFLLALPILEDLTLHATFFVATGALGGELPTSGGKLLMMDPSQVRELDARGHEIGGHTVHHLPLTQLLLEEAEREVLDSKRWLEDLVGHRIESFAYPQGDYNPAVRELVRECGFRQAVTVTEGLVEPDPDWLALPRIWISPTLSLSAFRAKVSPALRWYRQLRERAK